MCLGVPGQVVEISDAAQLRARVDVDGAVREVSLAMLELDGPQAARVGDWVVVHLGFALARIEEVEAREIQRSMAELTSLYERELTEPITGAD